MVYNLTDINVLMFCYEISTSKNRLVLFKEICNWSTGRSLFSDVIHKNMLYMTEHSFEVILWSIHLYLTVVIAAHKYGNINECVCVYEQFPQQCLQTSYGPETCSCQGMKNGVLTLSLDFSSHTRLLSIRESHSLFSHSSSPLRIPHCPLLLHFDFVCMQSGLISDLS